MPFPAENVNALVNHRRPLHLTLLQAWINAKVLVTDPTRLTPTERIENGYFVPSQVGCLQPTCRHRSCHRPGDSSSHWRGTMGPPLFAHTRSAPSRGGWRPIPVVGMTSIFSSLFGKHLLDL